MFRETQVGLQAPGMGAAAWIWRTLLNFNPHAVSSEPSQNLEAKARDLLFPSYGHDDASEAEVPGNRIEGDKDEDANLLDMVEGAVRLVDVDLNIRLSRFDNAPDKVHMHFLSS